MGGKGIVFFCFTPFLDLWYLTLLQWAPVYNRFGKEKEMYRSSLKFRLYGRHELLQRSRGDQMTKEGVVPGEEGKEPFPSQTKGQPVPHVSIRKSSGDTKIKTGHGRRERNLLGHGQPMERSIYTKTSPSVPTKK